MRLLSDIVESIRQVCRYEKTVRVDTKALQSVMMIFVLVMLSEVDTKTFARLGVNLTSEPVRGSKKFY